MFLRADQAFGTVVISSHGEEDTKSRQSTTHHICERLRKKQSSSKTNETRERRNRNKIRHRNEIIVAMKLLARFLLTSDATHFVNRDIEGDVRDALVKIAPCCVRRLSIQQRQWYQDILQSCHCTRSLSLSLCLSPSNSSSKSHSCSHATSDLFLARRKGATSNFLQLRSKHIIQIFSCAKKKGRRSNFLRPLFVPSTLLWSFLQTRSALPLRSYLLWSFCFLVESANWPLIPLGSSLLIWALIVTIGPCATNRPNNKKLWKSHKASSSSSSTIIRVSFH